MSPPPWRIRARRATDDARILEVNVANMPEVGPLDDDRMALFRDPAVSFEVVDLDGRVEGIFVGLPEGLDYASPNYRWFSDRHDRFAYVDRIALEPVLRGLGVADAIYERFQAWAKETGRSVLCAEVNTVPPNPRSLAFHRRLGFEVVTHVKPYAGDEEVAMVEKLL